ncbi:MAG: molecular chaperone HtpG [Eubacteriales bacterium]
MSTEKGGISVETQHIFPVIKKWLYSEKEIFLREIVSNASDAVTKLRRLISLGEVKDIEDKDFRIDVIVDPDEGTITVTDNGIGMTEDEVRRYICQIALSGALDFINKYEGESENAGSGIIGHFGLGFYSSFMIADTVDVVTKSYTGTPAVKWVCTDDGSYELSDSDRAERGTSVVMHVTDDEKEYLDENKLREILEKYCSFMPVEVYFKSTKHVCEQPKPHEHKEGEEEKPEEEFICSCKKPINDIHPLWTKNSSDCTDAEYDEFYHKVFHDWREPMFHIHISADYPLNFKGILYFPRINQKTDALEGQVKLYYNQVFVADNIKEVIPEYMLMLKGVLDCPELPLNVSRSYLQNSGYVAKISAHITKKVADKINSMFNTDRAAYEKLWNDLKLFVEYGSLRDHKFFDRVKGSILLPLTDGRYVTADEYLESAKEKHADTVYYTTDKTAHAAYIAMFNAQGIDVVNYPDLLDTQFMQTVENDRRGDGKDKADVKFVRVDADVADALKGDGENYENEKLTELFKKVANNDKLNVKYENLLDTKTPLVLNISEQSRRMDDMMKMYRMSGGDSGDYAMPLDATLVVNASSPLVRRLGDSLDETVARQMYDLALLSQRQLSSDELVSFLSDSFDLLGRALGDK